MSRYVQRIDGQGWAEPAATRIKWACCDCGLVHDLVLTPGKAADGEAHLIGVAVQRNERATAAKRAWKRRKASTPPAAALAGC